MSKRIVKRTGKVLEFELPVKVEPQNGGYLAYCPFWEDCYAQGKSIEEAVAEINLVAKTLIEIYKGEKMKVPLKLYRKKFIPNQIFTVPVYVTP